MSKTEDRIQYYPEIRSCGSLPAAISQALENVGSTLRIAESPGMSPVAYARIEKDGRSAQVFVALRERLFLVNFWSQGVCMAEGGSPKLDQVALAIHQWITDVRLSVAQFTATFQWATEREGAAAFEEGRAVEWAWEQLLQDQDRQPEVRALVKLAAKEPRLRELFPYTSMQTLCFSRCTGYPFTRDTPCISPLPDGQYRVSDFTDRELGRGDADAALRIAVEHLPPDCGPAIPGTADDLASPST